MEIEQYIIIFTYNRSLYILHIGPLTFYLLLILLIIATKRGKTNMLIHFNQT